MCAPGSACGCHGHGSHAGIAVAAAAVVTATAVGALVEDLVVAAGCITVSVVVILTVILVRLLRNPGEVLYRPGRALPVTERKVIAGRVVHRAIEPPSARPIPAARAESELRR